MDIIKQNIYEKTLLCGPFRPHESVCARLKSSLLAQLNEPYSNFEAQDQPTNTLKTQ